MCSASLRYMPYVILWWWSHDKRVVLSVPENLQQWSWFLFCYTLWFVHSPCKVYFILELMALNMLKHISSCQTAITEQDFHRFSNTDTLQALKVRCKDMVKEQSELRVYSLKVLFIWCAFSFADRWCSFTQNEVGTIPRREECLKTKVYYPSYFIRKLILLFVLNLGLGEVECQRLISPTTYWNLSGLSTFYIISRINNMPLYFVF